jgi:hypothetical protein
MGTTISAAARRTGDLVVLWVREGVVLRLIGGRFDALEIPFDKNSQHRITSDSQFHRMFSGRTVSATQWAL